MRIIDSLFDDLEAVASVMFHCSLATGDGRTGGRLEVAGDSSRDRFR
jgi:hypothetical protein